MYFVVISIESYIRIWKPIFIILSWEFRILTLICLFNTYFILICGNISWIHTFIDTLDSVFVVSMLTLNHSFTEFLKCVRLLTLWLHFTFVITLVEVRWLSNWIVEGDSLHFVHYSWVNLFINFWDRSEVLLKLTRLRLVFVVLGYIWFISRSIFWVELWLWVGLLA